MEKKKPKRYDLKVVFCECWRCAWTYGCFVHLMICWEICSQRTHTPTDTHFERISQQRTGLDQHTNWTSYVSFFDFITWVSLHCSPYRSICNSISAIRTGFKVQSIRQIYRLFQIQNFIIFLNHKRNRNIRKFKMANVHTWVPGFIFLEEKKTKGRISNLKSIW